MKTIKLFALLLASLSFAVPGLSHAAGGSACGGLGDCLEANIDPSNKNSLQRGAKLYVNYCLGCHAMAFQRYNRIGQDLGMSDKLVEDNLMFTSNKVGSTMDIAMPKLAARKWFGQTPPDLSVMAREKGVDYLYSFLKTFYVDRSKPTGVNNVAFPATSMPWMMWDLQGWQKPVMEDHADSSGESHQVAVGVEPLTEGSMSPEAFDQALLDLVNFMNYSAEPIRAKRQSMGIWVIAFLLLLFVFSYFLKREYWKDIH